MNHRATVRNSNSREQALARGRDSWRRQAWGAAFSQLSAADREGPLDPEDLVELAQSALLTGKDVEGADLLARAHQGFLSRQDMQPAARCAFWLGFTALLNGEVAKAGGWLSRAGRLLEGQPECVEKGYLLLPSGYRAVHEGDPAEALAMFARAALIGERFGDRDLSALALQGQGRALIRQGKISKGVTLLDEAMVGVTAGEVSPLTAGGVYCSVIEACGEIFDLRRAQEWTSALQRWCESQPDIVPYRGHCLVRRAELLQLQGSWEDALQEARRACDWLSQPAPRQPVGAAYYRVAEVHRLRGEFAEAETAYQEAGQWSRTPQPGLARLRLAQGKIDAANAAIRRMTDELQEPGSRALVLDAYVEIMLAAQDVCAARAAADELMEIAERFEAPFLHAVSLYATGAVLLAERDARGASAVLKKSWNIWSKLEAPYEAAQTRVLMALACRELGDEDAAVSELTAARKVFQQLGAAVDLSRLEAQSVKKTSPAASPLTEREVQVLRLVAAGMTNRGVAAKLRISEKTVARHLSNIFNKLDLPSRSAATAYAYQHELV